MDTSPTSLFNSYEEDFKQIIASIREKLDGERAGERGEQRKATLRRVEMELDEAEEMVSQMDIELQSIPQSIRPPYTTRARSAKSDLSALKKRTRDLHAHSDSAAASVSASASARSRAALLSSDIGGSPFRDSMDANDELGAGAGGGVAAAERARLLRGTTLLEDGSRRLQDAQRVALETEGQGADILTELRRQREQIENSRDTLRQADSSIDRASGTLKKMIRRMYKQRVITVAIIILLVALILFILWAKLFR